MSALPGEGQVTGNEGLLYHCRRFSGTGWQQLPATSKCAWQLVQLLLARETGGYPQTQLLILDRKCNVNGPWLVLTSMQLSQDILRTMAPDAMHFDNKLQEFRIVS